MNITLELSLIALGLVLIVVSRALRAREIKRFENKNRAFAEEVAAFSMKSMTIQSKS